MDVSGDRCHLCQHPGAPWCPDTIACYFRARRRLGIPYWICVEARARDYRRLAIEQDQLAELMRTSPPRRNTEYMTFIASSAWQSFADEQRLGARHSCEDHGGICFDLHVHHLNYSHLKQGRMVRPDEVLVLCPPCHQGWDEARRAGVAMDVQVTVEHGFRHVVIHTAHNDNHAAGMAAGRSTT